MKSQTLGGELPKCQRKTLVLQASRLPSEQAGSAAADTTIAQFFVRLH
jgi:hypothetical protein